MDAALWSVFLWRLRAAASPPLGLLWAGIAAFQAHRDQNDNDSDNNDTIVILKLILGTSGARP